LQARSTHTVCATPTGRQLDLAHPHPDDHSSIVTTQGNLHASDSDLRRAVRRLPKLRVESDLKEHRKVFPAGNTLPSCGSPFWKQIWKQRQRVKAADRGRGSQKYADSSWRRRSPNPGKGRLFPPLRQPAADQWPAARTPEGKWCSDI
jgi:hypothetical protein